MPEILYQVQLFKSLFFFQNYSIHMQCVVCLNKFYLDSVTQPQWSSWSDWSDCDQSCGTGSRERSRFCSSGNPVDCGIDTVLVERCNTQDCIARKFMISLKKWQK